MASSGGSSGGASKSWNKNAFYVTKATDAQYKEINDKMSKFWPDQRAAILKQCTEQKDFKVHNDFPLARIKRIMKSDEDVRMIRAEAPILFAKACELFILELTIRSYAYSDKSGERHQISRKDIEASIRNTAVLDFLVDVLEEQRDRKKKKS